VAPSADVVIRARPDAYIASFAAIEADITRAAIQLPRLFP
jgi:hypothetical protein